MGNGTLEVAAVAGEGAIVAAGAALVVGAVTPWLPLQSRILGSSPRLVGSRMVSYLCDETVAGP